MSSTQRPRLRCLFPAVVLISIIIAIAGCAIKPRMTIPPSPSVDAALKILRNASVRLERFEATCSMGLQAGILKASLFGKYHLEPPDRFAVEFNGPFGVSTGELVVADGYFELSMPRGDVVYGRIDTLDLENLTGIPFPTDDLISIFSPMSLPPTGRISTTLFEVEGEDSLWVWRFRTSSGEREIWIDPFRGIALNEKWFSDSGKLLLEKTFDGIIHADGLYIPKRISLRWPGKVPIMLEIELESSSLNPSWKVSPFLFKTESTT